MEVGVKRIQSKICKSALIKNNKFENYVKKCDDCYLLVILQDSSKGSFCFYTDSLLKHKYISKFKEVFFYDEKKKQAYKLCTQ